MYRFINSPWKLADKVDFQLNGVQKLGLFILLEHSRVKYARINSGLRKINSQIFWMVKNHLAVNHRDWPKNKPGHPVQGERNYLEEKKAKSLSIYMSPTGLYLPLAKFIQKRLPASSEPETPMSEIQIWAWADREAQKFRDIPQGYISRGTLP